MFSNQLTKVTVPRGEGLHRERGFVPNLSLNFVTVKQCVYSTSDHTTPTLGRCEVKIELHLCYSLTHNNKTFREGVILRFWECSKEVI